MTSGMSCSMTRIAAPSSLADAQQQRAERLGLALGDAARRLVEQDDRRAVGDDAGEVDDAARAGRQLAHELDAERPEAQQLDQLVDPLRDLLLGVEGGGRWSAARSGRGPRPPLERDRDRLLDRERREEPGVLERPAEPVAARRSGGARDVDAAEHDPARRRRG